MKCFLNLMIWLFAIIGFLSFFLIPLDSAYFQWSCEIDTDLASKFGDFFGGFVGTIFSIMSILLLFYSTKIKDNADEVKRNFFKMIDYHNNNVSTLTVAHIDIDKNRSNGRRAFVVFRKQLRELIETFNKFNTDKNLSLSKEDIAEIAYNVFHYGMSAESERVIREKCRLHSQEIIDTITHDNKKKLDRTNQTSLSSYFRNMFNAIKLVDESKELDKSEKKNLIKIYRAQLSDPELYVLFFNLMSKFGKKWKEKKYIETYKFIKNIPQDYCDGYDPKEYFNITYEYEE